MNKDNLKLWGLWTIATAVGIFIGYVLTIAVGAIATVLRAPEMATMPITIAARMGEGACFSYFQWLVLKRYIKDIDVKFILYTAIAIGLQLLMGFLLSSFSSQTEPPVPIMITAMVVLGAFFLLPIGIAQWLVLRKHVEKAWRWIVANAIAWPLGVVMPLIPITLAPDKSSPWALLIASVIGVIMTGLTVGAVTGIFLVRLFKKILNPKPQTISNPKNSDLEN